MLPSNLKNNPHLGLRVEKLVKRMDDFVIEADFTIEVGERVALVGRSGSGKSTLLRMIAGLENPSEGRIFLGNEDMTHLPPQNRETGFVFQDQALFWNLSVVDNATFGLRMRGVSKKERDEKARPWLEKVGLGSRSGSSVESLSGGEKQRVAWIRALIWKPRLLLLDEPFTALDAEMKEVLRNDLLELHRLWPVPMLMVTHDESDIQKVATARLNLSWDSKTPMRKVSRELTNS